MTEPLKVWGAPEGWDAFLLAQRRREYAGPVVHVARDDARITLLEGRKSGPGCRRGGASRAGLRWLFEHTAHTHFTDVDADGAFLDLFDESARHSRARARAGLRRCVAAL